MSARRRSRIARRMTQEGRDRLHAQEADRRHGPVRAREDRSSSRPSRARASSSKSKIVGGAVPKEYIPGVEKGLKSVLGAGVLAGFPVVDVKATLIDGAYHDVDSSALAFEIAVARGVSRSAAEGRLGAARADHEGRSGDPGRVHGLRHRRSELAPRPDPGSGHARQRAVVINAMVPLANMFGYVNNLRSMSARAAPTSRCNSTTTSRCRATIGREVQAKYA